LLTVDIVADEVGPRQAMRRAHLRACARAHAPPGGRRAKISMIAHSVRVHRSAERLTREDQLAWKIAAFAAAPGTIDNGALDDDVAAMIGCRVVDNAAVALAAINRAPVAAARAMALAHPRASGAALFGLPDAVRVDAEWAAWANATAVRELDFHDTF